MKSHPVAYAAVALVYAALALGTLLKLVAFHRRTKAYTTQKGVHALLLPFALLRSAYFGSLPARGEGADDFIIVASVRAARAARRAPRARRARRARRA